MNTIVTIPFNDGLAEFIGKKGSENSITFYNRKINEHVIVALMPSSLVEKFYALPQSLIMSDQIIVSTKSVDKLFGEVLVGCSLLDKRTIFTNDNDIGSILSGIKFSNITFKGQDELLDAVTSFEATDKHDSRTRIDVDKAFNVKGVGTVVLGFVTKGTVKVHETIHHNSGKAAIVRSIQSQDEDVKEAGRGTRVGLALKGIDESDITKGDIFSNAAIKPLKNLVLELKTSNFAKEQIEKGKAYFLSVGFSNVNVTVEAVESSNVRVILDRAVPAEIGDPFMLSRTIVPRIFASGKIIATY